MPALTRAGLALAACLAVSASAAAAEAARTIALTTASPEARAAAVEVVRRIENMQFGPDLQAAARKAVEADPQFAFGHYLVGVTGPGAQSKPHFDKATELARGASAGERRYIEAALLNRAQKAAEALVIFEALAREYPDERMVQMMLGQINLAQGKAAAARAAFLRAMALDAGTARVHALMANLEGLAGNYAAARELYRAALARRASGTVPGQVFFGLTMTYLYEGEVDAALGAMQAFLAEYQKSPQAAQQPEVFIWNAMARINLENGRYDAALAAYRKGYESVPGSGLDERQKAIWLGRLHHGIGRTLARMGKADEAWKEAEAVKKMIDEGGEDGKEFVPAWHYLAGYMKLEAGDAKAAVEHLKQADQDDPFIQLLLARAYEKAGDTLSARKSYQAVVESTQFGLDRALAYNEARKKLSSL
jgi:tetratricopeptide (TPR) repeat protein